MVGLDLFTKVASGELNFGDVDDNAGFPRMIDTFAARTRFYDEYFAEAAGIDLRADWPAALRQAGFEATQPTAWLAEGVLIGFLPPEAEVRLLDHVNALSSPASRFAGDYGSVRGQTEEEQRQAQIVTDRWREHGLDLHIPDLTYPGEHTDVAAHLHAHGWDTATFVLADLFDRAALAPLEAEAQASAPASISFVRATRR